MTILAAMLDTWMYLQAGDASERLRSRVITLCPRGARVYMRAMHSTFDVVRARVFEIAKSSKWTLSNLLHPLNSLSVIIAMPMCEF
jgi:hypothetical protein